jgi:hypothetical protein
MMRRAGLLYFHMAPLGHPISRMTDLMKENEKRPRKRKSSPSTAVTSGVNFT